LSQAGERARAFVAPRLAPIAWMLLTLVAGLSGRFLLPKGFFSKYIGDVLYTTLIYVLVFVARPRETPLRAALFATGLSFAIELFQLTGWPAWLSSKHIVLRLIFGTWFSVWDLVAYVVGAALGLAIHLGIRALRRPEEA
jgi:hypothetical protein